MEGGFAQKHLFLCRKVQWTHCGTLCNYELSECDGGMIRGTPSDITNINLNCGHSVDRADNLGKNSDPHCKSNTTAGCGIVYWSVEPLPCVKHDASHNFPIACFISRDILLYSLSDAISMKHVDATWTRRCGAFSEEMRVRYQVGMTNGRPGCIPLPLPVIVQCSNLLVSTVLYLNLIHIYLFWGIGEEIQFVERSLLPCVCVKECVLPHKLSVKLWVW